MNCKIYRGIIFILAIASIWQLATAVGDIFGSRYQYYFEKDSFFYNIEDEEYWYYAKISAALTVLATGGEQGE